MQKGNDGNTLQALKEPSIEDGGARDGAYSKNRELIILAQGEDDASADRATEELVILNSGLVRSVAMRFRDRGLELEDLIQIGTIGHLALTAHLKLPPWNSIISLPFLLLVPSGKIRYLLPSITSLVTS